MELILTIYWACLIIGGALLVILGFAGHLGGDGDVGVDHDVALGHDVGGVDASHDLGHSDGGISPFSPFVLATFLTIFGASGVAFSSASVPPIISAPLSSLVGFGAGVGIYLALAKLMATTQGTSHYSMSQLEGLEGTVVTPIPAEGVGEVAVTIADTRRASPARSADGEPIPKHATVRIDRVMGGTLLVRQAVDERLRNLRPDPPSTH